MNIEITPFTIWLVTRLHCINTLIGISLIISIFAFFIVGGYIVTEQEYLSDLKIKSWFKILKKIAILAGFFISLAILVPTQRDVAAMYVIPKIVNSEYVHKIGEKGLDSIENLLDYTNDVLKEKIKK